MQTLKHRCDYPLFGFLKFKIRSPKRYIPSKGLIRYLIYEQLHETAYHRYDNRFHVDCGIFD